MQVQYKKAIVALNGASSQIKDDNILINIRYALNALHIPIEIYKPHEEGFKKLQDDMNQDDTLYILNDSLQYHLCEKPNILISRSTPWVQATPKPNTIGQFTQEMIAHEATQLIACIARNKPMRQHYDGKSANTYILANQYETMDTNALARYGFAAWTWQRLINLDMHTQVVLHTCEGWPLVNEMLAEGMSCFQHPDDILILLNRDICLVPEATAIIRNHMDTHNIDECYAKRVDVGFESLLRFQHIAHIKDYLGIDVFAFRPSSLVAKELISVPLMLGRFGWDSFWSDRINHKLPYNICYHEPHGSKWATPEGKDGNFANLQSIATHRKEGDVGVEYYEKHFSAIK